MRTFRQTLVGGLVAFVMTGISDALSGDHFMTWMLPFIFGTVVIGGIYAAIEQLEKIKRNTAASEKAQNPRCDRPEPFAPGPA